MDHHPKKLYRSGRDRILFGVCGGLAEYFDMDPTIVRLAFVLLALASGVGIVGYLIFALVVPKAESAVGGPPLKDKVKEFAEDGAEYVAEGTKRLAKEMKQGKRGNIAAIFGVILVLLGLAFLIDNVFPSGLFRERMLWPILLVVIGLFLVAKGK